MQDATIRQIINKAGESQVVPDVENAYIEFEGLSKTRLSNRNKNKSQNERVMNGAEAALSGDRSQNSPASQSNDFQPLISKLTPKEPKTDEMGRIKDGTSFFDPNNPAKMKVQFNPASLRFGTEMDSIEISDDTPALGVMESDPGQKSQVKSYQSLIRPVTERLSMELIFTALFKGDKSVRYRVELFMVASIHADKVTFSWGKFNVTGILSEFNCSYTMFDQSGEPSIARVNIGIKQEWKKEFATRKVFDKASANMDKAIEKHKKEKTKQS
ncbi:MAG: hypothetical protein J6P05_04250 [Lachnospiraceae bacterium]|nr:hypothetical protein [Lachnospiraceae bacterium]